MKYVKRILILLPFIVFALISICVITTYNGLIDVQNTDDVISELQSSVKEPSLNGTLKDIANIEVIKTEKSNKIYAVLYSYADSNGDTCYGVELFKEHSLFKNRYEAYGADNGTKDVGYYRFSQGDKNNLANELIVFYGNCTTIGKKECVVVFGDKTYVNEPVSETFINIYELTRPADNAVFVYYQ